MRAASPTRWCSSCTTPSKRCPARPRRGRLLLTRASEQLDALALDAPDDPVLAEELAVAYHRLGNRARPHRLRPSWRSALGAAPTIARGSRCARPLPSERRGIWKPDCGSSTSLMARREAEDQIGPSFEHARAAVTTAESLVEARPSDIRFRRAARGRPLHAGLAISGHRRHGSGADKASNGPRRSFKPSMTPTPVTPTCRRFLALCHKRLGAILARAGSGAGPSATCDRPSSSTKRASRRTLGAAQKRRDLSTSNIQLGFGLRRGRRRARAPWRAYRRALALREDADARRSEERPGAA